MGVAITHCDTGTAEGRCNALSRLLDKAQPDIAVSVNIPDLFIAINRRREAQRIAPHAVMSVHGIEAYLYADARRYREMLDAVICTNLLASALTKSLGEVASSRILYSPYGVHVPPRVAVPNDDLELRIVYSGRLEAAQKRAGDLVGIVHSLQQRGVPFRLEIAGDGPDRSSIESALRPEIEAGSVHFHGHVSLDELKTRIYPSAHALVITSHWETGPIVAWEAMAQGVPVVSARYVGSGREGALSHNRNALLFDIGDVDGAATALARLWREPETRGALSVAATRLINDRYSIPASVLAWDRSLREILSQPRLGPAPLPPAVAAGRLDRWFGASFAERIRRHAPLTRKHAPDPGGEWPHSHAKVESDVEFWKIAKEYDVGPSAQKADHVA
jgi:glycosyltransferase involved in cell wall biosynthesis